MKFKDFETLTNAFEAIEMAYETCDTTKTDDEYETWTDINEWNEEFIELWEKAKNLKEQMIFVFKLEAEE